MKEAVDQRDPKVMHFAVDMERLLVDGLETFFKAHPRLHRLGKFGRKEK